MKIGLKSPKSDLKVLNITMLKEKRAAGAKFFGNHLKTHEIYIFHSILGEGANDTLPPPFLVLGGGGMALRPPPNYASG